MSALLSPAVDPGAFADRVLGLRLFPHQLDFARSPARYRIMCAGRQVGKSTSLAVVALHEAATRRNIAVLLVSSGDDSSKELLATCATLAKASPLLADSVLDDTKSELVLSNGSTITAVPASMKRIRGRSIDLLILDEAGFIDPVLWRAAEPSIVARPGSRVILSSTPWGSTEHFFRVLFNRGLDGAGAMYESFRWATTESPLADQALVEEWRRTWPSWEFEQEVLAQFVEDTGAYFSMRELSDATASYELLEPAAAVAAGWQGSVLTRFPVAGGIDWGMARDQNAVALLGVLDDQGLNDDEQTRLFVPWVHARHQWGYSDFLQYLCDTATSYDVRVYASEANGVGAWPTDDLRQRLWSKHELPTVVSKVWTDVRRKQSGFGMVKALLGSGRLVLPQHPELLKELRALEFEQLPGGSMRIAVPERAGHDDLAMALMQAVSCVHPQGLEQPRRAGVARSLEGDDVVVTPSGIRLPARPVPATDVGWMFRAPAGREKGEAW